MKTVRRIAKNTSVLLIAQIISYVCTFFITMYLARYLGVEGFSVWSIALSITGIFGIFADLGLGTLMIREIARDKSITNKYISNTALMKVFLSFLTFGLIALTVNIFGYAEIVKNVTYILALSIVISAFIGVLTAVFQANEKMEYISISNILSSIIMVLGTVIMIYYKLNLIFFASLSVISSGLILVFIVTMYIWKFSLPKFEIDFSFWKSTLNEAWPFGIIAISTTLYVYIDSIMLSLMAGNDAVGIYNAAYKLIFVLLIIPSVFFTAMFPVMSQHFNSAKNLLKMEYETSFKYLCVFSIFIFTYGFVFADKMILSIFGNGYLQSIDVLQILMFSIPLIFLNALFGNILPAVNKQRVIMIVTVGTATFNVLLNIILIPKFSYIGASIAIVLTESLGFTIMFLFISKYYFKTSIKQNLVKPFLAGFIIFIIIYYLKIQFNWVLVSILGFFIYLLLLYSLQIIKKKDIGLFKGIISGNIYGKVEKD